MITHPKLLKTLGQPDDKLFTNGACHIFACALLELLPEQTYSLKRLRAWNRPSQIEPKLPRPIMEAYHLYAFKDGNAVDVTGLRKEAELLAVWETKSGHEYDFDPVDCPP